MQTKKHYWLVGAQIAAVFLVVGATFAGMGVWRARTEQVVCFERALRAQVPYYESWIGASDEAIAYAEIEAIAFVLKKKLRSAADTKWHQGTPTCPANIWIGFWREFRALNLRQLLDRWRVPDDDIARVARNALRGWYRELDTSRYRCATEIATTLDVAPTWYDGSLVEVRPPVGRIRLYGPKRECGGT